MKKIKVPTGQIRADISAGSFNAEMRTVDVIFATEIEVIRVDSWSDRKYIEILDCNPGSVRLERANAGAPVLDSHNRYSLENQLGVVERAWVADGKCHATLRFSEREEIAGIVKDIESRIIRNISAGYKVHKYEITEEDGKLPIYRATDWEPMELSMLTIPADYNAQTRNESKDFNEAEIIFKTRTMANEATKTPEKATPAPTPAPTDNTRAVDTNAIRTEAVNAERVRVADVTDACQRAGLPTEFATNLITAGTSIDEARAAIIDEIAKNANKAPTNKGAAVTGRDEADQIREAISLGIMHRADPGSVDISKNEKAKAYGNMRLVDLAKDRLRTAGESTTMLSEKEIVKRAMATTDFPVLLANTAERSLRRFYDAQVPDWKPFARQENANDFREKTGIKVDGAVTFEEIAEGGQYKEAPILQDEDMKIRLKKYGRKYSITDIAIINDDLGVFRRLPQLVANGALQFQSDAVWGLIKNNVTTPDGVALFHATHKNLASPAAVLSETTLSAARTAMRRQKSPAGGILGLKPKYLVVPPELETTAQKLLTSVLASSNNDVNVFANSLQLVVSDALTDTKNWYVAADPQLTSVEGLVYSYLNGEEGLHTESRVNFDTDSVEVKARLFFAAAAWGFQGWYKNAGA